MIILGFVFLLFSLAVTGLIYQYIATKIDEKKYPPIGKLVDIGEYRLHVNYTGEKGPTVVLESGFGVDCLGWYLVQQEITKFAKVCSYDRAGYGWSDQSPYPRTGNKIIEELHSLLINSKISPPYVLVGHSLGGGVVQGFAKRYPEEVIGLVLVDSAHERADEMIPSEPKKTWVKHFISSPKLYLFLNELGLHRLRMCSSKYKKAFNDFFKMFPEPVIEMIHANKSSSKQVKAMMQEASSVSMKESILELKNLNPSFGSLPLTVIASKNLIDKKVMSDTKNQYIEKLNKRWRLLQEDLVTRSSNGKILIAENSDHMIPLHQPEIIVNAVREILENNKFNKK